jgi:hypothetical protein
VQGLESGELTPVFEWFEIVLIISFFVDLKVGDLKKFELLAIRLNFN